MSEPVQYPNPDSPVFDPRDPVQEQAATVSLASSLQQHCDRLNAVAEAQMQAAAKIDAAADVDATAVGQSESLEEMLRRVVREELDRRFPPTVLMVGG